MPDGLVASLGVLLEKGIRAYVRVLGRRVAIAEFPWLDGPTGAPGQAGMDYYEAFVASQKGQLTANDPEAGLLASFESLRGDRFDPGRVEPRIRDFYERTARYALDAWSQWHWPFTPFAWILISLVSRRIDQINLPIAPLETSQGMTSEVLHLGHEGPAARFRGWFRRLAGSGHTVYAGFYTTETPPGHSNPCVKVVFPVPHGNITVLLRPEAQTDGSFKLISDGKRFGDPGFYRVLRLDEHTIKVRYMRIMKEVIHVYVDDLGVLRTTHTFSAWRWLMLQLNYKMSEKAPAREAI